MHVARGLNPQHKQAHTPIRRNGDHDHRSSDCTIELTGLYIKCRDRRDQISEIARQQTLSRYAFACIPVPGAQASLSLFLRSVLARALEPWAAQARAAAKDGESSFHFSPQLSHGSGKGLMSYFKDTHSTCSDSPLIYT